MSDEALDPSLQAIQGGDDFERQMQLRRIVQEAFVKVASKEAAAKALKARPRIQRTFKVGEAVYVYRVLRKKKSVQGHESGERGHGVGQKALMGRPWIRSGYGRFNRVVEYVWRVVESCGGTSQDSHN